MNSRFISNVSTAILGGMLVATSLAFAPSVVRWLALGIGCTAASVTLVCFAFRGRGAAQRSLDSVIALLAAWTIVAACAFTGGALRWLSFSEGAALCGLAVLGLVLNEALLEHQLVWVSGIGRIDGLPSADGATGRPDGLRVSAPSS